MADNIAITAGSGTTVSTEEVTTLNGGAVSAQHLQRVANAIRTADGTAIDLPGDASNGLDVDVTRLPALAAGSNSIGTLGANSGVDIGDVTINNASGASAVNIQDGGNSITIDGSITTVSTLTGAGIAHDGADSGNPHKIGAKAETTLSSVTLVADADRTDLYAGLDGALIVRTDSTLGDVSSGNASNTDGTSTQVIAAAGAGIKTYLTDVTITNTSSSNIYVEIKDGATAKWTFPVPANGGVTHSFRTPIAGTANTAWNFDPSAATTTVYCSAAGFKSKI